MKAIDFPGSNSIYAKNQSEYLQRPSYKSSDGMVTSCYELTWRERIAVLFGAKVWLCLMTFNKPLQPQWLYVGKTMEKAEKRYNVSERNSKRS